MKIHIHTLGCKVNQYESQAVASMLADLGHELLAEPEGADALIINTCAVTAESVRKSRQAIRHLASRAPGAVVAVCGCWPQTEPDKAREADVDVLFGSGDKKELVRAVLEACETKKRTESIDQVFRRRLFEPLPSGSAGSRTRALLKIEDGCANFCAYCIIPYARGAVRSLPIADAAKEAARLMAEGYREIVLTGIEIASYGRDLEGKPALTDVVKAILEAAPSCRIRLGSLEPGCVTEDFCATLAPYPNLAPHFHLSLQSGCDATLERMRRKYTTERFYESVTLLRRFFPNCGITTDVITGFPGETEEEFSETLAFIRRCAFSGMHIFPYSVREGTPAASMENQVPRAVKAERARRATEAAREMKRAFMESQVGRTLTVLFETEEAPGLWQGHSGHYLLVRAEGVALRNTVCSVTITGLEGDTLRGGLSQKE